MTLSDPPPGFQSHCILTSRISQKQYVLGTKILKNTNKETIDNLSNGTTFNDLQ